MCTYLYTSNFINLFVLSLRYNKCLYCQSIIDPSRALMCKDKEYILSSFVTLKENLQTN